MTTPTGAEAVVRCDEVTVVTALRFEAAAVRRRVPAVPLLCGGISLRTLAAETSVATPVVLSVGVAGGLSTEHERGTVVIPSAITSTAAGGTAIATDPSWTRALTAASERLGYPTVGGTLATSEVLVTGAARAELAGRGFVAVDMESTAVAAMAARVAVVRVILDTPVHEFAEAWLRPQRAVLDPRNWSNGVSLFRGMRAWSARAACVLAEALRD